MVVIFYPHRTEIANEKRHASRSQLYAHTIILRTKLRTLFLPAYIIWGPAAVVVSLPVFIHVCRVPIGKINVTCQKRMSPQFTLNIYI